MADTDWDDIIRDNTPRLRSFVRQRVGNSDDADDIVQDTLYQFLRTIRIMDNPVGQVTSWLYTVARNLVINHGRKHREVSLADPAHVRGRGYMAELSEVMMSPDSESPEMLMLRKMVWEALDKAMAELPREQREAIEMTEIQGLPTKEAARRMGVSQNTFLSRKHYGVVYIRARLRALYDEIREA